MKAVWTAGILAYVALWALIMPGSQAVESCVETTNYTQERCKHEVMR